VSHRDPMRIFAWWCRVVGLVVAISYGAVSSSALAFDEPDGLGRLLLVTLESARLKADLRVLAALHSWVNSWRGIGAVESPTIRGPDRRRVGSLRSPREGIPR